MKAFVNDVLNGHEDNYILPFFWQHGETEEVLRDYMRAIHECGIGAVCVEARPHPDFAGFGWWHDMDIILDEARKRSMKVWILDDAHFPTGYANGKLDEKDDSLCKQYIACNYTDVYGPVPEASLNVELLSHHRPSVGDFADPFFAEQNPRHFNDDRFVAVVAARLMEGDTVCADTVVLTDQVKDGWLEWNVPDGVWRIFVFYLTRNGGGRTRYINMLDEASCHVQIEAVYEPHYAHYKDDFGKTIAGFFSDEPAVGNTNGFDFTESIGRNKMNLPWNKDMDGMLKKRLGSDYARFLPALWADMDDPHLTGQIRYAYMDGATQLISQNFSRQIGKWCEDHGVEYIGHIVEDSNQHSRLGCSMGHYFRSMMGQHMSGIDDIGNQVMVGGENNRRSGGFGKGGLGEFFHFELGKLGSSFAHIDPKKKGRAMCEIFGAYGWKTGVRTMKYLTDHFLVRGINVFVPHAFSPKAFPDPDCPPHFYAHGENPQYRHFGKLMGYMNRMCHLLSHGQSVSPVALLYHGEAEWTGGYMFDQKPARQLLEHQVDFDIIPSDVFADPKTFDASFGHVSPEDVPAGAASGLVLTINKNTYKALVVPYAQYVTLDAARFMTNASRQGFPVIFVDQRPEGICTMANDKAGREDCQALTEALKRCGQVVPLAQLGEYLQENGIGEVKLDAPFARLRCYHYVHDQAHVYMISNEEPWKVFEGTVTVAARGAAYGYDAMENRAYRLDGQDTGHGTKFTLKLAAYESTVIIFDETVDNLPTYGPECGQKAVIAGPWKVSLCEAPEYPAFKPLATLDKLHNIGRLAPDFSGFICYEGTFDFDGQAGEQAVLSIDNAYEGVEVWVNDIYAGMRICPPYTFDISKAVKAGENSLRIEVATTLVRKVNTMQDSAHSLSESGNVLDPTGIVGDVAILSA